MTIQIESGQPHAAPHLRSVQTLRDPERHSDPLGHDVEVIGPALLARRNGGDFEKAQQMAAHESPRTTKLYDRRNDIVSLDEVEKVVF